MASRRRVTPRAVTSPVRSGCRNDVCTNDWAARLYTSVGLCSRRTRMSDTSSCRSAGTSVSRSIRWVIRSKVTVLLRRCRPTTSYPLSSRSSARYEPSWPVMPVMSAVGAIPTSLSDGRRASGAEQGVGAPGRVELPATRVAAVALGEHRFPDAPVGGDVRVVPGHAQFVCGVVVGVDEVREDDVGYGGEAVPDAGRDVDAPAVVGAQLEDFGGAVRR